MEKIRQGENLAGKIIFINEPKVVDHWSDKEKESRKDLSSKITEFLESNDRFKNKDLKVTFSHAGVSSLVAILDISGEKMVLKTKIKRDWPEEGEAETLKAWEDVGVSVPHVFEEGKMGEHSYMLMQYIDAPTIAEYGRGKELLDENLFFEMGQTLNKMHRSRGEGYGEIVNGRGEHNTFKEWIEGRYSIRRNFEYIREHKVLNDGHGSLEMAIKTLIDYMEKNPEVAYCHNDFSIGNIFKTKPLTVFDPDSSLNHPYIDLGRSIVLVAISGAEISGADQQILDGYSSEGEVIDRKVLQASIIINAYQKVAFWHKINRVKRIKSTQDYLQKTKHFLEQD